VSKRNLSAVDGDDFLAAFEQELGASRRRAHLSNKEKRPIEFNVIITLQPISIKVLLVGEGPEGLDIDEYAKRYENKKFGHRKTDKGQDALYCAAIPLAVEYIDEDPASGITGEKKMFVYSATKKFIVDDMHGVAKKVVESIEATVNRWQSKAEEDDFRVLGRVHLTYMNGVHPDALPDRTAWEFRFILSMGTPDIDTDDDDYVLYAFGDINELINKSGRFKCDYFRMEWERVYTSPLLAHSKIIEETGPVQYLWAMRARTIANKATYNGSPLAAMSRLEQHVLSTPDKSNGKGSVNQGMVSWCYFMHIQRSESDHIIIKKEIVPPVRGKCRVGKYNK